MLLAAFRVQFPEFRGVGDTMVQAHLDAALLEIDVTLWGKKADQGQGYLCAHKLAMSPFGQNARMVNKQGETTYEKLYMNLVRQVSSGFRVA